MIKATDGRTIAGSHPYDRLRTAIVNGDLAPGAPLVETTLAQSYQVSRTPIRDALARLTQDGLVERGSRGMIVRQHTPEEILDLYETRIILEGAVAEMAAANRSPRDVAVMRRFVERDRTATLPAPEVMARWNTDFHRSIWAAARNSWMVDLLERLQVHVGRYPATTLSSPGRWETSITEHTALVDAIDDGDGARAKAISAAHFTTARDIRVQLWLDEFGSETP